MAGERDLLSDKLRAAAAVPGDVMKPYEGGDVGERLKKPEQGKPLFGMQAGVFHFKGQDVPSFFQRKRPDVVQGACQDDLLELGGLQAHFQPDAVRYGRNLLMMVYHGLI